MGAGTIGLLLIIAFIIGMYCGVELYDRLVR